jgi:hypothetical protein
MPEKLEIVIAARDQASAVLKGVAGNLRGEIKAVEGASAGLATTSTRMAGTTVGGFGKMKGAASGYRAELAATNLAMVGMAAAGLMVAKSFIASAAESEKASTKLRVAIQAAGQGVSQPALEQLAKDLQKIVPYSDEAISGMMAFLASAKLNEDQIKRLTPALLDLGTFMGKDIQGAAKVLAYALETGTTKGFARLKIVVDETKFALDPVGALIDAINGKCGGLARAAGKDAAGQLEIFNNQVDELKESLGRGLLPALQTIIDISTPLVSGLTAIADSRVGEWALDVTLPVLGVALALRGLQAAGLLVISAATMIRGAYAAIGLAATAAAGEVTAANVVIAGGTATGMAARVGAGALGILASPIGAAAVGAGSAALIAGPPLAVWREAKQDAGSTERARAFVARRRAAGLPIPGEPFTGAALQMPAAAPVAQAASLATPQEQYESFLTQQGWVLPHATYEEEGLQQQIDEATRDAQAARQTIEDLRRRIAVSPAATPIGRQLRQQLGLAQSALTSAEQKRQSGILHRANLGLPPKVTNTAPNVDVSQAANNDLLIRVQMPEIPQGTIDDYTTEYLEDCSYAGDDF